MTLTASRSVAVALTSTALMGLSALAVPGIAGAEDTNCDTTTAYDVTGGSIQWGVKQSFRNYLQGPIAHGGWDLLEGTTFHGEERGADGRFVWPLAQDGASVTGADAATATGAGSVRLHGHDEILDTTLSNPTVQINGTEGNLKLDYLAKKAESFTPGTPFEWVEDDQAVAVEFTLASAPDFHSDGTVTVTTGATALNAAFTDALGNYGAGEVMDSVTLVLDVTSTCDVDPGGDDDDDDQSSTPGGIFGSLGSFFGSLSA